MSAVYYQQMILITSMMFVSLQQFDNAVKLLISYISTEMNNQQNGPYKDSIIMLYFYLSHLYFMNKDYAVFYKISFLSLECKQDFVQSERVVGSVAM